MPTVLIVEDDDDIRFVLRDALELEGYQVVMAANGLEGIERLNDGCAPAAILLDQNMPVMDGEKFLELKSRAQSFAMIPVVVLSATPLRSTNHQIEAFLEKPVETEALFSAIKKACR